MPMTKGQKIVAPVIRATSKNGVVHGVKNTGSTEIETTICGRTSLVGDEPVKRFQKNFHHNCNLCEKRLDAVREESRIERSKMVVTEAMKEMTSA